MAERKPIQIFIEGPQGSGKSSLSQHIATKLGIERRRGIPTGEELARLKTAQIWRLTRELACSERDTVFDRSILSLIAYKQRVSRQFGDLVFNLGMLEVNQILRGNRGLFLLVETSPENCWSRQLDGSMRMTSREEVLGEVNVYQNLGCRLRERGVPVVLLSNEGISFDSFLYNGLGLALDFMNSEELVCV